ncbi:hypothetical protein [uncultured Porphyromonas sp.]|uniref:hypothetical protein n=1 Tax=uncultured Porphyromonas sp. TaxID=159274 RepID=UPI002635E985|nr:hypothetical protein [uncultured Porphyromonas sp.]
MTHNDQPWDIWLQTHFIATPASPQSPLPPERPHKGLIVRFAESRAERSLDG